VLTIALPLLFWLAGAGAWFLPALRSQRHEVRAEPHPRLRHGTHATALAICLMIGSVWITATNLQDRAEHRLWSGHHAVATIAITPQQWHRQSAYLAQQFEPRFWLTADERWSPTSVNWYLKQSGAPTTATQFCNPAGCYQIRKAGCDGPNPSTDCAPGGWDDPALYYRYFDSSDQGQQPAAPPGSWRVIQYWIFYNYDSLAAGAITQWHQSDWEQVSVLVQHNGMSVRPVEVAFSEHCYGARLPAERVEWTDVSHPVVFVGSGSHANYSRPVSVPVRQLRCSLGLTPRYFGVAGLFFVPAFDGTSLELPVAYGIGLRDRANRARLTPPLRLLYLPATPAVSSFGGYWGLDNNLTFLHIGRLRTSAGPPAPPKQGPWRNPFASMLCAGTWLSTAPSRRAETSWICPSH
jgi:hypothetical protein